ncbi:MAG TPA: 5-oxoprolinase subunit PxpA [Gammaproteobacteria bacterium]|nr:5-oxoprolinase subunit PxpA [Gammaproteobacteria bacterium]HPI96934.1 5-oxoprolinase subunit PxpA [Gammaproteobacteria bacterium]
MQIDINCDLGEGIGNDAELMPYLGSCNIACGGHFGDKSSMSKTILLAKKHNVKIGAHPSFPDKKNFGRRIIEISNSDLHQSLYQQLSEFKQICVEHDAKMHHVKLHGALYNLAARDAEIAALTLDVFAQIQPDVKIYVPYNSAIALLADDYFPIVYEAFADRSYNADLSLVNRNHENAVITDKIAAFEQVSSILKTNKVKTIDGQQVTIYAETFCVHGDQPNALEILKYLHQCL